MTVVLYITMPAPRPLWPVQGTLTITLWPAPLRASYSAYRLLVRPSSLVSRIFRAKAGLAVAASKAAAIRRDFMSVAYRGGSGMRDGLAPRGREVTSGSPVRLAGARAGSAGAGGTGRAQRPVYPVADGRYLTRGA